METGNDKVSLLVLALKGCAWGGDRCSYSLLLYIYSSLMEREHG